MRTTLNPSPGPSEGREALVGPNLWLQLSTVLSTSEPPSSIAWLISPQRERHHHLRIEKYQMTTRETAKVSGTSWRSRSHLKRSINSEGTFQKVWITSLPSMTSGQLETTVLSYLVEWDLLRSWASDKIQTMNSSSCFCCLTKSTIHLAWLFSNWTIESSSTRQTTSIR